MSEGEEIVVTPVADPRHIPGLASFLRARAPGLLWSLGLVSRWGNLEKYVAARWRFYVIWPGGLPLGEEPRAILMGDPGGMGWWGIVAPSLEDARRLAAAAPLFTKARSITGSPDILQPLVSGILGMGGPWAQRASLALCRPRDPRDGQSRPPPGVSRANQWEVPELMAFDPGHKGEPRVQVSRVLRARSQRGEVFVLRKEGRVLGMGEAIFAGPFRDVQRVKVLKAYRGQGLGRRLMEGIISDAARTGHDLSLCVEADNAVALGLYTSLGFEVTWRRSDWTREP